MLKNLAVLCTSLMMILSGSIAVASDGGGGKTKEIKSKASGTFVSTNFDFDHPDLSTPANYTNGEARSNAGQFTFQGVNEYTPDLNMKTCTVPGGAAKAGTEYTLVSDVGVLRFTDTGGSFVFQVNLRDGMPRFLHVPNAPFPVHLHRDRGCYWRHG